jgi:hypothetical protein
MPALAECQMAKEKPPSVLSDAAAQLLTCRYILTGMMAPLCHFCQAAGRMASKRNRRFNILLELVYN